MDLCEVTLHLKAMKPEYTNIRQE